MLEVIDGDKVSASGVFALKLFRSDGTRSVSGCLGQKYTSDQHCKLNTQMYSSPRTSSRTIITSWFNYRYIE